MQSIKVSQLNSLLLIFCAQIATFYNQRNKKHFPANALIIIIITHAARIPNVLPRYRCVGCSYSTCVSYLCVHHIVSARTRRASQQAKRNKHSWLRNESYRNMSCELLPTIGDLYYMYSYVYVSSQNGKAAHTYLCTHTFRTRSHGVIAIHCARPR